MTHPITIGGRKLELDWNNGIAKRFAYRLQSIGGAPTGRELTGAKTRDAATCKLLWALLPPAVLPDYPNPEELFVAIDQETEAESIASALVAIMGEMQSTAVQKKNYEEIAFARIELGITEQEWEKSHPEQCNSYIKAWQTKRERESLTIASLKLVMCQAFGVKIGGRTPRIEDFMPRKKSAPSHALSKARAQVAAIQSQAKLKK